MSVRLDHAPTDDELARLYYELSRLGATGVGGRKRWPYRPKTAEELLVLASQMLRYDPRLLSILVQWLPKHYTTLNPLQIRQHLHATRWPQSLLVACDFACMSVSDTELDAFTQYLSFGFQAVDPAERFFLYLERPESRTAARNLGRNFAQYARWGYVAQERPIVDPMTKKALGVYDDETRQRLLEELVARYPDLALDDYLGAVDWCISPEQGRAELNECESLERTGDGSEERWRRKTR